MTQNFRAFLGAGVVGQLHDLIGNHVHLVSNLGSGFLEARCLSFLLTTSAAPKGEADQSDYADRDRGQPREAALFGSGRTRARQCSCELIELNRIGLLGGDHLIKGRTEGCVVKLRTDRPNLVRRQHYHGPGSDHVEQLCSQLVGSVADRLFGEGNEIDVGMGADEGLHLVDRDRSARLYVIVPELELISDLID